MWVVCFLVDLQTSSLQLFSNNIFPNDPSRASTAPLMDNMTIVSGTHNNETESTRRKEVQKTEFKTLGQLYPILQPRDWENHFSGLKSCIKMEATLLGQWFSYQMLSWRYTRDMLSAHTEGQLTPALLLDKHSGGSLWNCPQALTKLPFTSRSSTQALSIHVRSALQNAFYCMDTPSSHIIRFFFLFG